MQPLVTRAAAQGESLYDNSDEVIELTQSTFPGRKDAGVWMVEFYAPWYS